MNNKELNETLKKLGDQLTAYRQEKNLTLYAASKLSNMASNSGLRHLEAGGATNLITLLKASKGLALEFIVKDGQIEIKKASKVV